VAAAYKVAAKAALKDDAAAAVKTPVVVLFGPTSKA
jgi:hypothetical protein